MTKHEVTKDEKAALSSTLTSASSSDSWDLVLRPHRKWFDLKLGELWRYRDLVMLFVRRDFVSLYKQTILGPLWYLIQLLLTTITFTIVFGRIAKLTRSYWLLGVVGADVQSDRLTPLLMDLYSQAAADLESENTQILAAIDRVRVATEGRGIWAIVRGGDRGRLLEGLLSRSCRFVVRHFFFSELGLRSSRCGGCL